MPRFLPLIWSALASLLMLAPSAQALAQVHLTDATTLVIAPVPGSDAHVEALVRALSHAGIAVVYNTGGARSDQAAQKVAEALGLERRPYDLDPLHADRFAGWLVANVLPASSGRAVVVIAPADVIPHILKRAAAVDRDEIWPISGDDLLTLTLAPSYVSLVRGRLALPVVAQ